MSNYLGYDNSQASFSISYHVRSLFHKVEFIICIIACLVLITTSKVNHKFTDNISLFFVDISAPIIKAGSTPFRVVIDLTTNLQELITARAQNKLLREENQKLQSLYVKAINIEQENKELRDILNFVGIRSTKFKSARLIAKSHQLYGRNFFINAGLSEGVGKDAIVVGKSSMIGRLVQVGEKRSRVLLVSDVNSRVPVITANSRQRGILAGNDSDEMDLLYLGKTHNVKVGDMVYTSAKLYYLVYWLES